MRRARVSGLPGYVIRGPDGRAIQTVALEASRDGRISVIYVTRNPGKLRHH